MKCYTKNLDRLDLLHFPSKKKILSSQRRDQVAGYLLPVVNLYHFVLFSVALVSVVVPFFFSYFFQALSNQLFPLPCARGLARLWQV